MRAPSFWDRNEGVAPKLLAPLAALYGALAAHRMGRPGKDAGMPVVCIGNLTHGGAGKTPAALAVARLLMVADERPFFLSRGYRGRLSGPVRVDPAHHGAAEVGDEPLLLARLAPTIIARDRLAGAALACAQGAGLVVMDDRFQNPAVAKDLAILVVDGQRGIGNGRVFPAGPLRAPLAPQLDRAQALIVVGDGTGAAAVVTACAARAMPIFRARLEPEAKAVAALAGRRVLAFAGIADPEKFFATLAAAGIDAPVRRGFADHHRYSGREAAALIAEADRQGLIPLTTEKDLARLAGTETGLAQRARALPIRLAFEDSEHFRRFLLTALPKEDRKENAGNHRSA